MPPEEVPGNGDNDHENYHHDADVVRHPADHADVDIFDRLIDPVEAAVEPIDLLVLGPRFEIERALRGLERQSIQGAVDGGGGNNQRELPK